MQFSHFLSGNLFSNKLGSNVLEESMSGFILIYKMVLEGDIYIRQSGREHLSVTSPQMSDPVFPNFLLLGGIVFPLHFILHFSNTFSKETNFLNEADGLFSTEMPFCQNTLSLGENILNPCSLD